MKARCKQLHQLWAEHHACHADATDDDQDGSGHQVIQLTRFLFPLGGQVPGERRHKGGGKRAFRKQIARQVR